MKIRHPIRHLNESFPSSFKWMSYFLFLQHIATQLQHIHLKNTLEWITGWRRPIGCLKMQVIFLNRATNYRALLRKMTYEDKAFYNTLEWVISFSLLSLFLPPLLFPLVSVVFTTVTHWWWHQEQWSGTWQPNTIGTHAHTQVNESGAWQPKTLGTHTHTQVNESYLSVTH